LEVVESSGDIVGIGPPIPFVLTDYEDFTEDLRILGISKARLGLILGRSERRVYHWSQSGVPGYAKAYVDLAFENLSLRPPDAR
jgi:hypothetical protein